MSKPAAFGRVYLRSKNAKAIRPGVSCIYFGPIGDSARIVLWLGQHQQ